MIDSQQKIASRRLKDRIVNAALELAEDSCWEAVRLHQVAERTGTTLNDLRVVFREKEEIVDAWFDRADHALLELARDIAFHELDKEQRIHRAIMTWLAALSEHRRPTRQMIFNKFEFGHLHYQVVGATRVSRTVQWIREVAALEDVLPWRAMSEAGMTAIYLAAFCYWMFDNSENAHGTSRFLERQLKAARPLAGLGELFIRTAR